MDIRYFKPVLDSGFHAVDSPGIGFGFLVSETWIPDSNRTFYRFGGHIELIRFKEYYGMPRGHSLSIYGRFSDPKTENFTVHFTGKRQSLLYPNREQGSFFSITIFIFLENLKKNWPEKRVLILSEYIGSCSCPLRIP